LTPTCRPFLKFLAVQQRGIRVFAIRFIVAETTERKNSEARHDSALVDSIGYD